MFGRDMGASPLSGFDLMKLTLHLAALAALVLAGMAVAPTESHAAAQCGKASWYGGKFHGRKTASGERFNQNGMSAAHRTLPFGTKVRVKNLNNGRSVVLRINDRGPFSRGRVIDVSKAAASKLGFIRSGTVRVKVERIGGGSIKGGYRCS